MNERIIHLLPVVLVAMLLAAISLMLLLAPVPEVPENGPHAIGVSYRVKGCSEHSEGDYMASRSPESERVAASVEGGSILLTHQLRYVCCANLTIMPVHVERKVDSTLIVLEEVNTGEMCRCLCEYVLEAIVGPLEEGRYLVRLEGVRFGDIPPALLWQGEFEVNASTGIPNPASIHCRREGGRLEIRKDESGGEYGVCIFPDGSECEEWAFYHGTCAARPEFCGRSTFGSCDEESDCIRGGCSSQVCQSIDEDPVITTCEWRDCYKAENYGLSCGCVDGRCQWH